MKTIITTDSKGEYRGSFSLANFFATSLSPKARQFKNVFCNNCGGKTGLLTGDCVDGSPLGEGVVHHSDCENLEKDRYIELVINNKL